MNMIMNNRLPLRMACIAGAISAALFLIACSGGNSEALLAKAQTALDQEDRKSAEIHLKNLLQSDPQHVKGRMLLAQLHMQARDERSAAKEWQRALDAGADVETVLPKLLASLHGSANFKDMIAAADRYPVKTESARAEVLYWRGQALWQERQPDEAKQLFNEALAVRTDHHP
ncbi:MAG: tetratricopeptide repeat protein, partial [Burkholderiales bacterium]